MNYKRTLPYLTYPVPNDDWTMPICVRVGTDGACDPYVTISIKERGFFSGEVFQSLYQQAVYHAENLGSDVTRDHFEASALSGRVQVTVTADTDGDFVRIQMIVRYQPKIPQEAITTRLDHKTCERIGDVLEGLDSKALKLIRDAVAGIGRLCRQRRSETEPDEEGGGDDADTRD